MNHAHHDHAGHAHAGHAHAGHGHSHGHHGHSHAASRPQPRDAAFSLLRASALTRFAIAGAAIAAIWAGVFWAMA